MHGFSVHISKNKGAAELDFEWKPLMSMQSEHILRNYKSDFFTIEQFTANRLIDEKLWVNHDDFFIVSDGVVTNLKGLCRKHKVENYLSLIDKIKDKPNFYKEFRGHFAGFIYYKKTNEYCVFNNHCGSKKVFYFANNQDIFFSTDLYTLNTALKKRKIARTHNIEAAYLLLTSGFMHENLTLINEIQQLGAGEYASIKENKITIKSYFHLSGIKENSDTKPIIIEQLDKLFKEAVRLEFEIDKTHNLKSITTLSGGLDSRMVALMAHKLGYTNQQFLNFSEKGYADEIIAQEIATAYKIPLTNITLNAESLCNIEEIVSVNDGHTLYSGAGHVYDALNRLEISNTGMIHTGMIGDAVLGSFLSKPIIQKPSLDDGLYSKGLFAKAKSFIEKYIQNYPNEEIYKFYNRAFMGANNGFLYFDLVGETTSAFLDPDFLTYAYSIPLKYKYKEKIYIAWIKKMHPEFGNFTWEAIGGKPTNNELLRQYYKYKRAIIKRLPIHTMWKNTMTPEQLWYDSNIEIKRELDNYFEENIHLLLINKDLLEDCKMLYLNGNITEKTQVITLLAAYKLLF